EAAAVAAGARAEDVTGDDAGAAGGVGGHLLERPAHVGQQVLAELLAVDLGGQGQAQESFAVPVRLQLVRGDQVRAEGGGGVLALARAEAHPHLRALEVPRGPVVEDGVADDVVAGLFGGEVAALPTDHGAHFEFEVEHGRTGGYGGAVPVAVDRVRIGEVEG